MLDGLILWLTLCALTVWGIFHYAHTASVKRGTDSAELGMFTSCRSWTAECAKARPLAECRMDAVALGCKAQPQAPTASASPFARWASACVAGQGCGRVASVTQPDPFDDIPSVADDFDAPETGHGRYDPRTDPEFAQPAPTSAYRPIVSRE